MRSRFLILHNSGSGWRGRKHYEATVEGLRQSGAELEIIETQSFAHGHQAAKSARLRNETGALKYDAVIAAGGDGTIHTVASGLLGGEIPLGIIPLGTGNVLARELGIKNSATSLVDLLRHGSVRNMPVGAAGKRIFMFVLGVGFDAQAVHYFEQARYRHLGRAGFVWPALQALGSQGGDPVTVLANKRTIRAHWVIITRVRHYAANLMLAPEADPFGRSFHVVCFKGAGAMIRLRQLTALVSGLINRDPSVEIFEATEVRLEGAAATSVQIDGENMGTLPLHVAVHEKTLPIIVPDQD